MQTNNFNRRCTLKRLSQLSCTDPDNGPTLSHTAGWDLNLIVPLHPNQTCLSDRTRERPLQFSLVAHFWVKCSYTTGRSCKSCRVFATRTYGFSTRCTSYTGNDNGNWKVSFQCNFWHKITEGPKDSNVKQLKMSSSTLNKVMTDTFRMTLSKHPCNWWFVKPVCLSLLPWGGKCDLKVLLSFTSCWITTPLKDYSNMQCIQVFPLCIKKQAYMQLTRNNENSNQQSIQWRKLSKAMEKRSRRWRSSESGRFNSKLKNTQINSISASHKL